MVKVLNIKYEEYPVEPNTPQFKKCVEYAKLIDKDYKLYLPDKPKKSVEFELHDANSDLANAIRRGIIDEVVL